MFPSCAAFEQIAASRGLGVSILGSVVYVGPAEAALRLRTLAAPARRRCAAAAGGGARKFQRARPMRWDDLATPRSLLARLAEDNGLELAGLDLVPHDLWAAAYFPPLSLTDRLTLVAVQFDLTFAVQSDGAGLRLAPLPRRVALRGAIRAAPIRKRRRAAWRPWPGAEVEVVGGDVRVRGLVEDHERIEPPRPAAGQTKSPSASRDSLALKRFTLTVTEKPVGPLLRQLASQWKLELAVDEQALTDAGISLDRRISFHVREATADQLLRAIADAAGLSVSRRGGRIEVGARGAARGSGPAPALPVPELPRTAGYSTSLSSLSTAAMSRSGLRSFIPALQFHIRLVGKACIGNINAQGF